MRTELTDQVFHRRRLTEDGVTLMEICPGFDAVESEMVRQLSDRKASAFTRRLSDGVQAAAAHETARAEAVAEA